MVVKVLGKYKREGVSKTSGKPYKATGVFVSYPMTNGGEGDKAESVTLFNVPYETVAVGASYHMEYDRRGYVDVFQPVK